MTATRSFDTEQAGSSYATGFVVDARRGIILTNRHVVKTGPITAEAVFLNREEVKVHPLYRDPIHDFGFMRFDPADLKFMELKEVPLAPEAAAVGIEIRVVGNDSGEKISILAGTIARLDRDAPVYSAKGYNDFNTFYLQAASGTKGGSSGSPVIDVQGRAIALNAGGKTKSASAFFLPLNSVVRALEKCQACWGPGEGEAGGAWRQPDVPRGDLQLTLSYKGFDEVRRLGLRTETEARVREEFGQENHGMLVIESVVEGGPAEGKLKTGDILVRVNGKFVAHFWELERVCDGHVGKAIEVEVERGGEAVTEAIAVEDLHAVTPSSFLEVAGASIHGMSYQQARNFRIPVGQLYVADPGYMLANAGVPKYSVIKAIGKTPVSTLEDFALGLKDLQHGDKVKIEYVLYKDKHRKKIGLLKMDKQWYPPPLLWTRDDVQGVFHPSATFLKRKAPADATPEAVPEANGTGPPAAAVGPPKKLKAGEEGVAEKLLRSLCLVEVEIPPVALADGVHSKAFCGNSVIVYQDDKVGLVVTDRNTIAISPGDITLTFGAFPVEVIGTPRFLHPTHNFAIVSYDPTKLPQEAREAIKPAALLPQPALRRGDKVQLVGLSKSLRVTARETTITNATAALHVLSHEVPRFRPVNEEVIELDQDFGHTFSGVLADAEGRVRALWISYSKSVNGEDREFCAGLSADLWCSWVDRLAAVVALDLDERPNVVPVPTLGVELDGVLLSKAKSYGLSSDWIKKLADHDPERRQVLMVKSCIVGGLAGEVLREGDMLLEVGGQLVSAFKDLEGIVAAHFAAHNDAALDLAGGIVPENVRRLEPLKLTILRDEAIEAVSVQIDVADGLGTKQLVHWAGAQLQEPHRGIYELGFLPEGAGGVYISRWHHGSPAHRYGVYALHWILEVNGTPTPTLQSFLDATSALEDGTFVRLRICHLDGKPKVLSLRTDLRYWPTWRLALDQRTGLWTRETLMEAEPAAAPALANGTAAAAE